MFDNPFSPIFGGRPNLFFGRKDILLRFDSAMRDKGSEDRALFITGTRGSGKTALLEQLSSRAKTRGMRTIDLGPENAAGTLLRTLVCHEQETRTIDPQASVSIMGMGGGLRAGSLSKTTRYDINDLVLVLPELCDREQGGLFISIDEVQKVPIEELSTISNAFQMASRKGSDIMIALAGLPYAHDEVIHHEGCTFFRRAPHHELGLLDWGEAHEAFVEAFGRLTNLSLSDEAINELNTKSYGHPYLMQLLGYHLVFDLNERALPDGYEPTVADVERITPAAYLAYERRALRPLYDELSDGERAYLRALNESLGGDRTAATSDVAKRLGKGLGSVSRTRDRLLREGVVISPGRGLLMFNIPLLASFLERGSPDDRNVRIALARGV